MAEMRIGPKETWEGFVAKVSALEPGQGAFVPSELFERFFGVPMNDPSAGSKAKAFANDHGVATQPRRDHHLVVFFKE